VGIYLINLLFLSHSAYIWCQRTKREHLLEYAVDHFAQLLTIVEDSSRSAGSCGADSVRTKIQYPKSLKRGGSSMPEAEVLPPMQCVQSNDVPKKQPPRSKLIVGTLRNRRGPKHPPVRQTAERTPSNTAYSCATCKSSLAKPGRSLRST
jgi:hypothetical protein